MDNYHVYGPGQTNE